MTIDKLTFRKIDSRVVMEGKAAPGATVVVENKSLAPFVTNDTPDVFARAVAGSDGMFSVEVKGAREGDRLKVGVARGHGVTSAVGVRLSSSRPSTGASRWSGNRGCAWWRRPRRAPSPSRTPAGAPWSASPGSSCA
jgi:hypothetical protein